ncbi:MAG: hypothetical protein ABJD97_05125 [Betaproteobacteria bacterium]
MNRDSLPNRAVARADWRGLGCLGDEGCLTRFCLNTAARSARSAVPSLVPESTLAQMHLGLALHANGAAARPLPLLRKAAGRRCRIGRRHSGW